MLQIDKEGANIERVKQEMSENGLLPEEWGGETPMVAVRSLQDFGGVCRVGYTCKFPALSRLLVKHRHVIEACCQSLRLFELNLSIVPPTDQRQEGGWGR